MKQNHRLKRQQEIEAAAYELLREKGYKATSMLAIAKYAGASNETLYKWYGNKQGLFKCLIEKNINEIKLLLENKISAQQHALDTLSHIGVQLLTALMGEKAITLNRAAATDVYDTNELGKAIAKNGREVIAPLLSQVFEQAQDQQLLTFTSSKEITETYICLLVGDWQIRRVIDAQPIPSRATIKQRASLALEMIVKLYPSESPSH